MKYDLDVSVFISRKDDFSMSLKILSRNIRSQSQSQSVFVRARENPKHKQTAQRRLLIIIYINKISNAISVTSCLSSG